MIPLLNLHTTNIIHNDADNNLENNSDDSIKRIENIIIRENGSIIQLAKSILTKIN